MPKIQFQLSFANHINTDSFLSQCIRKANATISYKVGSLTRCYIAPYKRILKALGTPMDALVKH